MKLFDDFDDLPDQVPRKKHVPTKTPENSVAIYTMLSILFQMRSELGLEAMLEYMESYQRMIEESNPKFKSAVREALRLINVQRLYRKAIDEKT